MMRALLLLCIKQRSKFQVPSFIYSTYMIGAKFGQLPLTDPRYAVAQRMLKFRIASYGNQTISSTRPSC